VFSFGGGVGSRADGAEVDPGRSAETVMSGRGSAADLTETRGGHIIIEKAGRPAISPHLGLSRSYELDTYAPLSVLPGLVLTTYYPIALRTATDSSSGRPYRPGTC